jgi:hypothetical protein
VPTVTHRRAGNADPAHPNGRNFFAGVRQPGLPSQEQRGEGTLRAGEHVLTGKVKHDTLAGLRPYYAAIKSAAALVSSHHEKQAFLKVIYQNFYKVYKRRRIGWAFIYTPNEIVRFMVESAD